MVTKLTVLVVIALSLCIGIASGYSYGFQDGVRWTVHIGLNFVDIDVDEEMLTNGIFAYKNQINNCFEKEELQNALIYNDSGNQA